MSRIHNPLAVVLALLALAAFTAPHAAAQGLAMTPAMFDLKYKPGQPAEFDITVVNETDAPITLQGTVQDWWYNDKNEKVFGPPATYPRSAANWVEFVPRQFEIPARGRQKVHVVVTPPTGGTPGGHYAVLFIESKPELVRAASAEGKALFSNIRLGALLMLTQDGTQDFKLEVVEPQLTLPSANQNLRLQFALSNLSNTHVFPRPQFAILDAENKLVGKADAEMRRYLPGQRDRVTITWPSTLAPGSYKGVLTIIYGDNRIHTQEFPFTIAD